MNGQPTEDSPKPIDLDELDRLLDRAKEEGWTQLALLWQINLLFGRNRRDLLIEIGWSPERSVFLSEQLTTVPARLLELTNLTNLDLSFNAIGYDGARELAKLANITNLDLSFNQIGDDGARELAKLANITNLDLSFNQIGDAGATELAKLANLTNLNLLGNSIGHAGATALANLDKLTYLNLSYNNICDTGASELAKKLSNLTSLDLCANSIGPDGATALAKLTNLTTLNLDANSIGRDGATALAALINLTDLGLSHNEIVDDSAMALAALPKLTDLKLSRNSISDNGATKLAELANLVALDLSFNVIGDAGATELAKLANLTNLNLWGNSIGDAGATALANLDKLTYLNLRYNKICDTGASELAKKLSNLTSLDLCANSIGPDGARALAEAISDGRLPNLQILDLTENKVGVGEDVLNTHNARYIAREILAVQSGKTSREVYEARLAVTGAGAAGKTWLCNVFFREAENPDNTRSETHHYDHVDIDDWKGPDGKRLSLRVCDFGGQHALHAAHEMFLSERSVYLVVLNARWLRGKNEIDYWLKLIRHFAGKDVRIVVVATQCDPSEQDRCELGRLDADELKTLHPGVLEVVEGLWSSGERKAERNARLAGLRAALNRALELTEAIRLRVSNAYLAVREAVRDRRPLKPLLSMAESRSLCAGVGETDSEFQDNDLSRLHAWGDLFYFGVLDFQRRLAEEEKERRRRRFGSSSAEDSDERLPPGLFARINQDRDSKLRDWVVDPRWLAWPLYEIARAAKEAEPRGWLTEDKMREIVRSSEWHLSDQAKLGQAPEFALPNEGFEDRFEYVLALLKFIEMSFRLEDARDVYIFPGLLDQDSAGRLPDFAENDKPITLTWGRFVPLTAFHRFMVRHKSREHVAPALADDAGEDAHRLWQRGAVLKIAGCRVLVTIDPNAGRIEVRFDPATDGGNPVRALDKIVDDLTDLVGEPPNIKGRENLKSKGPEEAKRTSKGAGFTDLLPGESAELKLHISICVKALEYGIQNIPGFTEMTWERMLDALKNAAKPEGGELPYEPNQLPKSYGTFRRYCGEAGWTQDRIRSTSPGTSSSGIHRGSKFDADPKRSDD